jgi:putative oxidoreductase
LIYIKASAATTAHRAVMSYLAIVGRSLFAGIFLAAAPRHFTGEAARHAAELGVPFARIAVPVSGVIAIAGALSVITGYRMWIGAALLIAFLVPVTAMMHAFWRIDDPIARHVQLAMFMKNVAMIGAALFMLCASDQ